MPGPHDFGTEQRSLTERLPLGLGSEGLTGWWPDIVAIGGGSLIERGVVRWNTGEWGFKDPGGKHKAFRQSLQKQAAAGNYGGMTDSIHDAARRSVRAGGGRPPIRPTPPVTTTSLVMDDMKFRRSQKRTFFQGNTNANKVAWHRGVGRARFAGRIFRAGHMLKGVGILAATVQAGAGIIDLSKYAAGAAIDWRPRRGGGAEFEFGGQLMDTGGARTQRQRALHAIHESQLSTRAAIGGEAAFMHG